jgi:hypothetical protein
MLWGRLATCGPIANRSIRARPGHVEPTDVTLSVGPTDQQSRDRRERYRNTDVPAQPRGRPKPRPRVGPPFQAASRLPPIPASIPAAIHRPSAIIPADIASAIISRTHDPSSVSPNISRTRARRNHRSHHHRSHRHAEPDANSKTDTSKHRAARHQYHR